MSSVGSLTTAPDQLLLQSIQGQNRSGPVDRREAGREAFEARLDTAAKNAGLSSSQVTQLHTDIQAAVQDALKNSSSDGSNRTAVRSAIDTVLQKYGIDPASVRPQHAAHGAHHHHKASGQTAGTQDGDADDTDPNAPPQNATDAAVATLLRGLPTGSLLDAAA